MVAGMLMPIDNLKAIYEHLFRDGVMVAKKDKRPQTKHPEIPSVDNLQVIRVMGSLKSRGYVRETFAWRHFYWYLTNTGIVYLRDYLHLPPEIVPTPLQRVRRPAATLAIAPRGAGVQAVQGPTSYVPKPVKMGAEKQEATVDRQEYRRKMMSTNEEERIESNERSPRFRGRQIASSQIRPKGSWEPRDQPKLSHGYTEKMEPSVRRKVTMHTVSHMPSIENHHVRPVKQEKMMEMEVKECIKTAQEQKTQKLNVSLDVPTVSSTEVESFLSVPTQAVNETNIEMLFTKETTSTKTASSKTAIDAPQPIFSKLKVEKTEKTVTKHLQDVPTVSLSPTDAIKENPKEEVFIEVSQKTTSTGDGKMTKDGPQHISSKPKLEKTAVAKNVQNILKDLTTETDIGQSSTSSVPTEAVKEKPKEEMFMKVSTGGSKTPKDAHSNSLKLKEKTQKTAESKNNHTRPTAESVAVKEKNKEGVGLKISQEINSVAEFMATDDDKMAKDASQPIFSKTNMDNIQKTVTKNVQNVPTVSSSPTEVIKEKLKKDVFIKVSQEITTTDDSKMTKDGLDPTPLKPKVVKTQKTIVIEKTQDMPNVSSTAVPVKVESLLFSETTEATKPKPKQEVVLKVSQKTMVKGDNTTAKDASHSTSKLKVEKTQKTVHDLPTVSSMAETFTTQSSMFSEDPIKASQEKTPTVDNKMAKDTPNLTSSKPKMGKTEKITMTKTVEKPLSNEKTAVTVDITIPPDHGSSVYAAGLVMDDSEKKSDINFPQPPPELPKVHKKVDIPDAIITAEVIRKVKGHKAVSQTPSTGADTSKTVIIEQTATKLESTAAPKPIDSIQQQPSPGKPTEEPNVAGEIKAAINKDLCASKHSKGKKKKHKSSVKTTPQDASNAHLPKVEAPEQVETNDSAKTSSEKMHIVESTQLTAVQKRAPTHKKEVESAQPLAEKREVLKENTSSAERQWEAPTVLASAATAAVSTQSNPLPDHREPPIVAQHSVAPDTHQSKDGQNRLSDSKAPAQPVNTEELTCDTQKQPVDDAMRKKIVVVEEVIEVQQIASPGAEQPVAPPLQEVAGDDLDYDVLEELAIERGILQSPEKETFWDHSLQEPEQKTFPNFIEGTRPFLFCLLSLSRVPLMTVAICICCVGGSR